MKILGKIAVGFFLATFLFAGCSKYQPKQKAGKTADSTATRAVRVDSFPREPKNFKSIHQLELEQHEKDSAKAMGRKGFIRIMHTFVAYQTNKQMEMNEKIKMNPKFKSLPLRVLSNRLFYNEL